jgi:hypothetical protein
MSRLFRSLANSRRHKLNRGTTSRRRATLLEMLETRNLLAAEITYVSDQITLSIGDPNREGVLDNPYVEVIGAYDGTTNKDGDIIDFTADPGVYAPELHGNDTPAITDKAGNLLYPINSEFGFLVQDFSIVK